MERKLALAKHLGLDVIEFNGVFYTGATLKDFNEFSGANYEDIEDVDMDNKQFINWLNESCGDLDLEINEEYGDNIFGYNGEEYLVVTDDEADDLWEAELDNYIDEIILPELNERYRMYFDNEAWKNDARGDGRAHSLNHYDGNEDTETVDNETFYIYRQN